ncbi:MAG: TerB family tellurite resistance protein [Gammaproteobacteria bacterium]|nr:TerB family tellurite resistance protein [Gammaproteobacteria bacterium]
MWLKSLTDEQREALLGLAHNVVVSDGILDPNEEDMLDEFKREMALKPDVVSDYLELDGIGEVFDSRRARTVAVLNLLRLSYVDGAFEIEEECLLKEVARAFGISDADFALMDNWVRRLVGLEREARDLMAP